MYVYSDSMVLVRICILFHFSFFFFWFSVHRTHLPPYNNTTATNTKKKNGQYPILNMYTQSQCLVKISIYTQREIPPHCIIFYSKEMMRKMCIKIYNTYRRKTRSSIYLLYIKEKIMEWLWRNILSYTYVYIAMCTKREKLYFKDNDVVGSQSHKRQVLLHENEFKLVEDKILF